MDDASGQVPILLGPPWVAWRTQTLDSGDVGGWPSIAIDADGLIHIAYEMLGADLRYVVGDGITWSQSTITLQGSLPSLALDTQGRPHVSFTGGPGIDDLIYGERNGAGWQFETVDAVGTTGEWSELRLDAEGFPHITYGRILSAGDWDLRYAFKDAGGWHVELIDADAMALWNGLGLGPDGTVHVAYTAPGGTWGRVKYATRGANGWSIQVIEPQGGSDLSMAVDALNRPHIAYRGAGETLKYATFNGAQWSFTVVDSDSPTGWYTSTAVDSQNRPHISYWQVFNRGLNDDPTRGHVKYATQLSSGQWFTEYVDLTSIGVDTSIAMDSKDRPHVAFLLWRRPLLITHTVDFDLAYAAPASTTLGRLGQ